MNDELDYDKIVEEVKNLTPEQVREELLKLRTRQAKQAIVTSRIAGPFNCERCGNPIAVGELLVDVAISYQPRPPFEDDIEFDPQDETYLCESCGVKLLQMLSSPTDATTG